MTKVHGLLLLGFNSYVFIQEIFQFLTLILVKISIDVFQFHPMFLSESERTTHVEYFLCTTIVIILMFFLSQIVRHALIEKDDALNIIRSIYNFFCIKITTTNLLKMFILLNSISLICLILINHDISNNLMNHLDSKNYSGSLLNVFHESLTGNESLTDAIDIMQSRYKCCGIVDPTIEYTNMSLPDSCCPLTSICTFENSYQQNCTHNIKATFLPIIEFGIAYTRGVILLLMSGIILSVFLVLSENGYSVISGKQFKKMISSRVKQFNNKFKLFDLTPDKILVFFLYFAIQQGIVWIILSNLTSPESSILPGVIDCELKKKICAQYFIIELILRHKYFTDGGNLLNFKFNKCIKLFINIVFYLLHVISLIFSIYICIMTVYNLFYIHSYGFTEELEKSFDDNIKIKTWESTKVSVDDVQSQFKCCGLVNATIEYNNITLPDSCCPDKINCSFDNIYKDGCKSNIISAMSLSLKDLGIIAFVYILSELVFFLLSYYLLNSMDVPNVSTENLARSQLKKRE